MMITYDDLGHLGLITVDLYFCRWLVFFWRWHVQVDFYAGRLDKETPR